MDGRSPSPPPAPARRAWLRGVIQLAMTLLVLAVLLWFVPLDRLLAAFGRVSVGLWLSLLAGMVALHVGAAWKWSLLVAAASGVRCGAVDALRAHGAGLFSNLFLPGALATDVVRAAMLGRSGVAASPVVVGGLADRLLDTLALATLSGVGAMLAARDQATWTAPAIVIAVVAGGVAIAGPALRWLEDERLPERVRRIASKLGRALAALRSRPGTAGFVMVFSLLLQLGLVLLAMALGLALGIEAPVAAWLLAWPLAKLAIVLPLTISGLGVREGAFAALMLPFGVEASLAIAVGLVWQTLQAALALVGGAGSYGSHRLGVSTRASGEGNAS